MAQTQALAGALGGVVEAGDVIVLAGDLGAGKTAFTQGLGAALGVTEAITSPTFTLHRRYRGRVTLHHLDVYRLDQLADTADLALEELFDDAVTVIEWGDTILPALPAEHLQVTLQLGEADDDRLLDVVAVGERWQRRLPGLQVTLAPWTVG